MTIHKTELAYCNSCERPAPVAVIELPGWRHPYRICSACLLSMAKILNDEAAGLI